MAPETGHRSRWPTELDSALILSRTLRVLWSAADYER